MQCALVVFVGQRVELIALAGPFGITGDQFVKLVWGAVIIFFFEIVTRISELAYPGNKILNRQKPRILLRSGQSEKGGVYFLTSF